MSERSHEEAVASRWTLDAQIPLGGVAEGASWHRARIARTGEVVTLFLVRGEMALETADAARRTALLDNPRLLPVREVLVLGEDDEDAEPLTVVEYPAPSAPPLAALFAQGALRAETARSIVGEAATALEAARRRGLRHQHLDSNRVFVDTASGEVSVLGAGVEAASHPDAEPSGKIASFLDTTALVALLYRGLTGAAPRPDARGRVPRPSHVVDWRIPAELDQLCASTLNDTEDDVPLTTRDLIAELGPWQSIPVTLEAYDAESAHRRAAWLEGREGATGAAGEASAAAAPAAACAPASSAPEPAAPTSVDQTAPDAVEAAPAAASAATAAASAPVAAPATAAPETTPDRAPARASDQEAASEPTDPYEVLGSEATVPGTTHAAAEFVSELELDQHRRPSAFPASLSIAPAPAPEPTPSPAAEAEPRIQPEPQSQPEPQPQTQTRTQTEPHPQPTPAADGPESAPAQAPSAPSAPAAAPQPTAPETAAAAAAAGAAPAAVSGAALAPGLAAAAAPGRTAGPRSASTPDAEHPDDGASARDRDRAADGARSTSTSTSAAARDAEPRTEKLSAVAEESALAAPAGPIVVPGRGRSVTAAPAAGESFSRGALARDVVAVALNSDDPGSAFARTPAEPAERSRIAQWILLGAALLVILALVFAVTSVTSVMRQGADGPVQSDNAATSAPADPSAAADAGASVAPSEAAPAAAPAPTISAVEVLADGGDPDHPEDSAAVTDGDPATRWSTRIYKTAQYGGLKANNALRISFAGPSTLTALTVTTAGGQGGVMELYALNPDGSRGAQLATGTFAGEGEVRLAPPAPVEASSVVLVIPELPSDAEKSGFRARIAELRAE